MRGLRVASQLSPAPVLVSFRMAAYEHLRLWQGLLDISHLALDRIRAEQWDCCLLRDLQ